MGTYVFNNQLFDSWLDKKSDEILSKVDREKITTEEMIFLFLKAQTNHFHHADIDMKNGLRSLNESFDHLENGLRSLNEKVNHFESRFDRLEKSYDAKFHNIDQRFEKIDHKIDNRFMWMIGITIAMSGGIYLKLFLG